MVVKARIFREYDIRGLVPNDLDKETVYRLGQGLGTYYQGMGATQVALGRDCRLSSPGFRDDLTRGLCSTGLSVIDIGMVPTPLLYFSLHHLGVDGGVQITGSHNPPEYNGFKVCLGTMTIYGDEIQKVREICEKGAFSKGNGTVKNINIIDDYVKYLKNNINVGKKPIKVIVDAGNGVGGLAAPKAYEEMGIDVEPLFCEPDGRFPNHHPDPTIPKNMEDLTARLQNASAHLGIGFDGDADRIGVVDRDGRIIWGDQLLIIFSRNILEHHPGAAIVGEVKCSQVLYEDIRKHGGRAIMWKAGHSLIKSKMKEEGALLGGEMSGHLFFADRYFGYDDAIYAGARLMEILSQKETDLGDLLQDVPKMVSTPEIRLDCPDEKKFGVVKALVKAFKKDYSVIDVDGARVLFDGGWGLVRASNTQPVLVLRFEAENQDRLEAIQKIMMDKLAEKM
jgi:phosphomannomutase/phosphoglucomutase